MTIFLGATTFGGHKKLGWTSLECPRVYGPARAWNRQCHTSTRNQNRCEFKTRPNLCLFDEKGKKIACSRRTYRRCC